MDHFVVSARKYRPKGFDEVVGQQHITTTLQNAIKTNQLAQAMLFCGPRGVGKTTCARILARMINDFDSDDGSSHNFNIYELDAASNNSVEDIRNLIDQVRYPPQYGKYKVYIIDEVHMLSNQAFNAFLKTLEEPPAYAIFILATTEKHKVIPTILSRCQIYDFNRIQISDIADHLSKIAEREKIKAEHQALHLIAQKADGALRDALSIFDMVATFTNRDITYKSTAENLHILDYDYYFRLMDHFIKEESTEAILLYDEVLNKGFDGVQFLGGLASHMRDLMMAKAPETVSLMEVSEEAREKFLQQSAQFEFSYLVNGLQLVTQCEMQYKSSRNQRLLIELLLIKLANLSHAVQLAEELAEKKK